MNELIKLYIKTKHPDILHQLRVEARKELAKLISKNRIDISLKKLLKLSSKVRDADVLIEMCNSKKIKKYLQHQKKRDLKKLLKFLEKFNSQIIPYSQKIECEKICKYNLLKKNDKKLHKIRILIKKCRYSQNKEELKPLQTLLGKVHDYYNCIKLLKKFNLNYKKEKKIKQKYLKKAYKEHKKICKK